MYNDFSFNPTLTDNENDERAEQHKVEQEKEIIAVIERYEYNTSGVACVNGGDTTFKIKEIDDNNPNYIIVYGETILIEYDKSTTYNDCHYYLSKEDFHILRDKEIEEYGD